MLPVPDVGAMEVMFGVNAENGTALLVREPLVTTTFPLVRPLGAKTTIKPSDQVVTMADAPLNVTPPETLPKFAPAMVTVVPGIPLAGLSDVMVGAGTVNATPLLSTPEAVTTTFPILATRGTEVVMLVAEKPEIVAATPLNLTKGVVAPKLAPVMVTGVPAAPD